MKVRARLRRAMPLSAGPRPFGSRWQVAEECRRAGGWPWCLLLIFSGVIAFTGACCEGQKQGSAHGNVLTVEQALASEPDEPINVGGTIVATGSGPDLRVVLASVLLESYPPQAGGTVLPVTGLDLASLVGLSSTVGSPDLSPVTWSDYRLTLRGFMEGGVLQVQGIPQVEEVSARNLRVRFSPVNEPLTAGGMAVWWAFDIQNVGAEVVNLTFASGQRAEVVLSHEGVERYRWSEGKAFTQALETVTIAPGEILPIVLNDEPTVEAGRYDLRATIMGVAGPQGAEPVPLPQLTLTVTVQ